MKGLVVGGTASGVGKTVATLAAIRALQDAGRTVQPAKAGPDFIDPGHHAAVADRPSRTLDPWMQGEGGLRRNYWRGAECGDPDVCLVEGVMGLYDGSVTSTAEVAAKLGLPVVLVVDASAGMQSVAATALGFQQYAAEAGLDTDVAGVVAQQCHGGRHEDGVRAALPDGLTYCGRIPPDEDLEIPDRHLGLQQATETDIDVPALDAAAEHLDAQRLLDLTTEPARSVARRHPSPTSHTVAVARDAAFGFCYPATMARLRERATVEAFSPLAGDPLPDADGVYLPGGYPELHAGALAASPTLDALAERAADGLPVFGECGGLMALAESLTTTDGERHAMAGLLPADVEMCERYQALDHVELSARGASPVADGDATYRGHEFHYSRASVASDAQFAFDVERGEGIDGEHDGLTEYDTVGTYAHCHAASGVFDTFLDRLSGG